MTHASPDSGFSLLEILLVLALLACLSSLALISARPPEPASGPAHLFRFLAERRADAILTGKPVAITIVDAAAQSGAASTDWSGELRAGQHVVSMPYVVVAFADGTYSGVPISVLFEGSETTLAGTFHGAP